VLHITGTWKGNPSFVMVALAMAVAIAIAVAISVTIADSVAVAVAIAHRRCRCRQPLPLQSPWTIATAISVALLSEKFCCRHSHHRPLQSPAPLAIAVAISIGHHHPHRRRPFSRVVALVRQELYSNNLSKECLLYFILFRQWAAHWSKPDVWPGVKRQWPTPALGGKRQAVSS
jgi:hypothetical protein